MSKSTRHTKDVSRWLDAPDLVLLKLVQEAANSTSQPTSSLVLAAQATLSIVDAVQIAQGVAPDVLLLVEHAVRVVGLLCRALMEDADGQNWHTEVGQMLLDLLIVLPKVLNLVKSVRFFDGFRTRAYLEELQTSMVKLASLVTHDRIPFGRSGISPVPCLEPEEEQETTSTPRNAKGKGKASAHPDGTHTTTSVDQGDSLFMTPMHVPPPAASLHYPAGYPLPSFPLPSCDAAHPYPSAPSMPQSLPTPGGVYFSPYVLPAPMLWNNNCGNTQNINITNHNHYFGTSGRRTTRRRESSVRDQVKMAQEIVQTISPPCLNVPPPPAVVHYPLYVGHPFMPGPPIQYSTPPGAGPYPASSFPLSLSNLDARTVSSYGATNSTSDSR